MLLAETIKALGNQSTSNNFYKTLSNECIYHAYLFICYSNKTPYSKDVLSRGTV